LEFHCRPTFREVRDPDSAGCEQQQQQQPVTRHHWCTGVGCLESASAAARSWANSKEVLAIECSWCKAAYHKQDQLLPEAPADGVVQPGSAGHPDAATILGWFAAGAASSVSNASWHRRSDAASQQQRPLLVLTNAKSAAIWALASAESSCGCSTRARCSTWPPAVQSSLSDCSPGCRICACSSARATARRDGCSQAIDSLGVRPWPPVAVLPLGTGNDLARSLNWGGGFRRCGRAALTKMLCCVEDGWLTRLDRWSLDETALQQQQQHEDQPEAISEQPLTDIPQAVADLRLTDQPFPDVFNNYFSLGADAAVALECFTNREKPIRERFNSRLRNMMFYCGVSARISSH
uniref:diacylglycerol kinase (ATP) n=1 Tax=Macrostomum lignano TaxID=282301 RepID=A0A1I8FCA5_9PLAT